MKKRIEETVLNAFLPISKKEIQEMLPDVSITTIELVLGSLLKKGSIEKIGSTKGAKYIKAK